MQLVDIQVIKMIEINLNSIEHTNTMTELKKNVNSLGHTKNKLKLAHQLKPDLKDKENSLFIPSPLTTPIVIRYIDPRLVPLLVELGKLSQMVENFAVKNNTSDNSTQREEIEELVRSSKDLSSKMSAILQQNDIGLTSTSRADASPEKVSSEYKYMSARESFEKSIKSFKDLSLEESDDIDMIDVLNKVSIRMEELQQENNSLKIQLQEALQQANSLRKEKEEMEIYCKRQEDKNKRILEGVKGEMQSILLNRQSLASSIDKVQNWLQITSVEEDSLK